MVRSIYRTQPPKLSERSVGITIALVDGPDPREVVLGSRLRFKGLCRETFFNLTVRIDKADRLDDPSWSRILVPMYRRCRKIYFFPESL